MVEGLCNNVPSYRTVCWCMNTSCGGQDDVRDAVCSGAAAALKNMRCVKRVGAVPEEDNSLTLTAIAAEVRISTARVFCVLLK